MKVLELDGWIGCKVRDPRGEEVGKLEEVFYAGSEPVLATVQTGRLSKKHWLVPLDGAGVSRDELTIAFAGDRLLGVSDGEQSPGPQALDEVVTTYGVGRVVPEGEVLEGSHARAERLAAEEEARRRAEEAAREAEQRAREADEAAARADEADRAAQEADEARRRAAEAAERARAQAPD